MPAATIDLFLLSKAERLVSASAAVAAAVGVVSMVAAVEPRNLFFFSFFFLFFFFLFSFFFFFHLSCTFGGLRCLPAVIAVARVRSIHVVVFGRRSLVPRARVDTNVRDDHGRSIAVAVAIAASIVIAVE